MDTVRYFVALSLVVSLPAVLLFWLLLHPFVRFWRRLGPVWTYSLLGALLALIGLGLFRVRRVLLAVEFGTSYPLVVLGALLLAVAIWLKLLLMRHLSLRVMLGLPELAPTRHPGRLVTEGLYARVRHPRYLQLLLALWGYAFIANYLALYLAVALWLPGLYVIVLLEERELRDRFGPDYEEYCRRVPRFFPRLTRGSGTVLKY